MKKKIKHNRFIFIQSILMCKTYFNPFNCIKNHKKNKNPSGTFETFDNIKRLFQNEKKSF